MGAKRKYKIIGKIIYYILRIILKTCKIIRIDKNGKIDGLIGNAIYIFWHNKLVAVTGMSEDLKVKGALASQSKDGELIAIPLEGFGYKVIRGSTGKGSVKSLLMLIRLLKKGYTLGTPVDGPKGPIYEVKPGMLYLSQKSGKSVVPVGVAYEKSWCFKNTWDKLLLPKPFSKIICYLGDPFVVGKERDLKEVSLEVKDLLNKLDEKAKTLLKK